MRIDTNIRPFFVVLERALLLKNLPTTFDLTWRKRTDCVCRVELAGGEVRVPVTDTIRRARARVDDATIRQHLKSPEYLAHYEYHITKLEKQTTVGLMTLASTVFGPLTSPVRTSHKYNPYVEFWLPATEIGRALGQTWLDEFSSIKDDLVQIRDAAEVARISGLLDGIELYAQELRVRRDDRNLGTEDDNYEMDDDDDDGKADGDVDWDGARNEIYFGPPGTGKSYDIERRLREIGVTHDRLYRMTFHPEASYFDLVGSYRPRVAWVRNGIVLPKRPDAKEAGEPRTYYDFVPGPLSLALETVSVTGQFTALVIEEINRANCAAVFGDIFQLLDRRSTDDDSWTIGWSSYSITPNREWADWLSEHVSSSIYDPEIKALRLPPKLLILASMNTSDQNLFPMDTAFRRRWSMKYVGINTRAAPSFRVHLTSHHVTHIDWTKFYQVINTRIAAHTRSDDKQIGPWFAVPTRGSDIIDREVFKSKVLYYLWNDVFGDRPSEIFRDDIHSYEQLVRFYDEAEYVFNAAVLEALGPLPKPSKPPEKAR